jgi:hypothetical protein
MADVLAPLAVVFNAVAAFLTAWPAVEAWVAVAAVLALVHWWTTPTARANETSWTRPDDRPGGAHWTER